MVLLVVSGIKAAHAVSSSFYYATWVSSRRTSSHELHINAVLTLFLSVLAFISGIHKEIQFRSKYSQCYDRNTLHPNRNMLDQSDISKEIIHDK
jgi:hypothetical protein